MPSPEIFYQQISGKMKFQILKGSIDDYGLLMIIVYWWLWFIDDYGLLMIILSHEPGGTHIDLVSMYVRPYGPVQSQNSPKMALELFLICFKMAPNLSKMSFGTWVCTQICPLRWPKIFVILYFTPSFSANFCSIIHTWPKSNGPHTHTHFRAKYSPPHLGCHQISTITRSTTPRLMSFTFCLRIVHILVRFSQSLQRKDLVVWVCQEK